MEWPGSGAGGGGGPPHQVQGGERQAPLQVGHQGAGGEAGVGVIVLNPKK